MGKLLLVLPILALVAVQMAGEFVRMGKMVGATGFESRGFSEAIASLGSWLA